MTMVTECFTKTTVFLLLLPALLLFIRLLHTFECSVEGVIRATDSDVRRSSSGAVKLVYCEYEAHSLQVYNDSRKH